MTLAERPYPFPSRTRKSSSPAPKILRGQPFGKIGRRRDFLRFQHEPLEVGGAFGAGILGQMTESVLSSSVTTPVATPVTAATATICPYLMSADGRWRASTPAREHRCTVVTPPAILATEKQRRLCLSADHVSCSTYLAALEPTAGPDRTTDRKSTRLNSSHH